MRKSVLQAIRSAAKPSHIMALSRLTYHRVGTELIGLEGEGLIRCVVEKRIVKRRKYGAQLRKLSDNPRTHIVRRYFLTDKGVKTVNRMDDGEKID